MAAFCLFITLCVVVLGAFVRLSDAGLGCPDWPGCYGVLIGVPESPEEIAAARANFPDSHLVDDKARKEVAHRYLAGFLGLLVFALAFMARRSPLAWALCGVIVVQALLGMWTVTLLLKPLVVVLHLLGGMLVLAMLTWLFMTHADRNASATGQAYLSAGLYRLGLAAGVAVFAQIALGGWVSANYAALACPDFPMCQSQWWPDGMDFAAALPFWGEAGVNYEFGRLDDAARTAIHMTHRLGAVVVAVVVVAFALRLMRAARSGLFITAWAAWTIAGLLAAQITLGISNVVFGLPLWVAVAHNGVAAVLLAVVVATVAAVKKRSAL